LVSSTPSSGATNVDWETNITLVFSEPVYWEQVGEINIRKGDATGSYVAVNIDPQDNPSSTNLVSGIGTNSITINPSQNLCELQSSWWYFINIDSDALADAAGNRFAGISNINTLTFTVEEPPNVACNSMG